MPKVETEIQEFVDAIGARFPRWKDKEYALFSVVPRRGNYFVHANGFMIVKLSRSPKPFWGLGKKHVDFLNDLVANYFLVLLESSSSGYLFDKDEINANVRRGAWGLSGSDYKINASTLPRRNVFHNAEQFLSRTQTTEG